MLSLVIQVFVVVVPDLMALLITKAIVPPILV